MTPMIHFTSEVAPPGSTLHYALRYAPPEQRATLVALFAFSRELTQLADNSREPRIATTRLDWWRGEVANTFAGRPTHPVTTVLAPALTRYNLQPDVFEEMLDGAAMAVDYEAYPTYSELALYCYRSFGTTLLLACEVLGYNDRNTPKFAHALGVAVRLTQLLRDIGLHLQRGRLFIPLDELRAHDLDLNDLRPHPPATDRIEAVLRHQSNRAESRFQIALKQLPAPDRPPQRCLLVLAALQRALLVELEQAGAAVLAQRISLTPLRKLWIAWNAARRMD